MTPKEKAIDIAMRFDKDGQTDNAVKCALICVDEIRRIPSVQAAYSQGYKSKSKSTESYWVEVKKEIEKL